MQVAYRFFSAAEFRNQAAQRPKAVRSSLSLAFGAEAFHVNAVPAQCGYSRIILKASAKKPNEQYLAASLVQGTAQIIDKAVHTAARYKIIHDLYHSHKPTPLF